MIFKNLATTAALLSGMATSAFAETHKDISKYYPMIDIVTALDASSLAGPNAEMKIGHHVIGDKGYATLSECENNTTPITQSIKDAIMHVDGNEFIRHDNINEECITGARLENLTSIYNSVKDSNNHEIAAYSTQNASVGVFQFRGISHP